MRKNFLISVLILLILPSATACDKQDESTVRVAQIEYSKGDTTVTLYSRVYYDCTVNEVTAEEYNGATEKFSASEKYTMSHSSYVNICADGTLSDTLLPGVDKDKQLDNLENYVYKTWYNHVPVPDFYQTTDKYHAVTYTAFTVAYLNILIIDKNTFEVTYYNKSLKQDVTERITTDYYKVTFFVEDIA